MWEWENPQLNDRPNEIPRQDFRKRNERENAAGMGQERHSGRTAKANKFLSIVAENIDGKFKLTDDNIERLLDAYRDLYKGMRKN